MLRKYILMPPLFIKKPMQIPASVFFMYEYSKVNLIKQGSDVHNAYRSLLP